MAKEILPVNFKDDIMSEAMEGRRRYRMIQNSDGTVSFEDTTEYDQVGSQFGQGQINKTNQAVNESLDKGRVIDNINDIASNSEAGYVMGALAGKELNQNLGNVIFITEGSGVDVKYYAQLGADAVSKKLLGCENPILLHWSTVGWSNPAPYTFTEEYRYIIVSYSGGRDVTETSISINVSAHKANKIISKEYSGTYSNSFMLCTKTYGYDNIIAGDNIKFTGSASLVNIAFIIGIK